MALELVAAALVAGMGAVAWFNFNTDVAFLWHNVIGAVTVVLVGLAVSAVDPMRKKVAVYSGEQFSSLGAEDTLSGGEVLPDLQINLKDLFAAIDNEGK